MNDEKSNSAVYVQSVRTGNWLTGGPDFEAELQWGRHSEASPVDGGVAAAKAIINELSEGEVNFNDLVFFHEDEYRNMAQDEEVSGIDPQPLFTPSEELTSHIGQLCHQVVMDDPMFCEAIGKYADAAWDPGKVRMDWATRLILMGVAKALI